MVTKALPIAKAILTNKWTWIGLGTVAAVVVVHKNWNRITGWFKRDRGDYSNPKPSEARIAELKAMAQDAYAKMDATIPTEVTDALELIYALNDGELRVVAEHFQHIADGSLKDWIDDTPLPWTDIDSKLIARLNNMAI